MSIPKVYIETTIPSFYHEIRTDLESAARKNWTQHWWDFKRNEYDLYTSEAVISELEIGDYPTKRNALSLLDNVPSLIGYFRSFPYYSIGIAKRGALVMESDSPLQRVRKARMTISEQCGHDPKKLVEYYMKLQERHSGRLVRSPKTPAIDPRLDTTQETH